MRKYSILVGAIIVLAGAALLALSLPKTKIAAPISNENAFASAPPLELHPRSHELHGFYFNERFSGAATEWRLAGDVNAGVTNRWQCDPRWSFYVLANDRKLGKPAAMWSKRSFPGDVSAEFFVGVAMNANYGNPYRYARDINVTIASDGTDLTKGYTFCFGGLNNSCSCIMRNGEIVKRIPVAIPVMMDYHLHWYHVTVERNGGSLAFHVDHFFDAPDHTHSLLEFEDPEPLKGNRVAIWTYDCPLSISRVTLCGETDGSMEAPDFLPGPLVTMYDQR